MKWTSKRTGDNIDLEFSRPVPANKLLIMSIVPAHAYPPSSREGSSKTLRRDSGKSSGLQVGGGGARLRWFQVFFGLSFRACRIAFLTANVREGLEAFWKGLPCWCLPQTGVLYWCVSDGNLVNRSVMLGSKADLVKLKTTPLLQPWRTTSLSK